MAVITAIFIFRHSPPECTVWRNVFKAYYEKLDKYLILYYIPRSLVRRDVRAAEGARLESVCTLTRTQGSNPCLSAIFFGMFQKPLSNQGLFSFAMFHIILS